MTRMHSAMCHKNWVSNPSLAELLSSWTLALRAERKSPATIVNYTKGVLGFLKWCFDEARS